MGKRAEQVCQVHYLDELDQAELRQLAYDIEAEWRDAALLYGELSAEARECAEQLYRVLDAFIKSWRLGT